MSHTVYRWDWCFYLHLEAGIEYCGHFKFKSVKWVVSVTFLVLSTHAHWGPFFNIEFWWMGGSWQWWAIQVSAVKSQPEVIPLFQMRKRVIYMRISESDHIPRMILFRAVSSFPLRYSVATTRNSQPFRYWTNQRGMHLKRIHSCKCVLYIILLYRYMPHHQLLHLAILVRGMGRARL